MTKKRRINKIVSRYGDYRIVSEPDDVGDPGSIDVLISVYRGKKLVADTAVRLPRNWHNPKYEPDIMEAARRANGGSLE